MSLSRTICLAALLALVSVPAFAQSLAEASDAAKAAHATGDGWPTPTFPTPTDEAAAVPLPASGAPMTTAPRSADPIVANVVTLIRTKCAKDWPTDFRMRAYCETQQLEALGKIAKRNDAGTLKTPDGLIIRAKCAAEWRDDFRMANYCEEQQLKALATLGR